MKTETGGILYCCKMKPGALQAQEETNNSRVSKPDHKSRTHLIVPILQLKLDAAQGRVACADGCASSPEVLLHAAFPARCQPKQFVWQALNTVALRATQSRRGLCCSPHTYSKGWAINGFNGFIQICCFRLFTLGENLDLIFPAHCSLVDQSKVSPPVSPKAQT